MLKSSSSRYSKSRTCGPRDVISLVIPRVGDNNPNKTIFVEVAQCDFPNPLKVISLENPIEFDPSLILMNTNEYDTSSMPMCTHNCKIKHELATLILDNGSQKNLIAQDLVQRLKLPNTLHREPYQLRWVQKEGLHLNVSRCCAVTFAIGPFQDTMVCDVSPLYCVDMLLGLPYQHARNIVYHAKFHKYHLQHEGHTYVLTCSTPHSTQPLTRQATVKQVILNKYVSLCLVLPIKLDHLNNPTPQDMTSPLPEVYNSFPQPKGLPPSCSMDHTIDLISKVYLPNASSYSLTPQEVDVIALQPDKLLNSGPTPPSYFPCASPTFLMPKHVFVPVVSANRLCTPTQVPVYYNTFFGSSSFSKQIIEKASRKRNSYKCSIAGINHL
jgi:hypothetical protein